MGTTELAIPATVEITAGMGLTPNEMRRATEASGRTETDMFGGVFPTLMIQALVWTVLRRQGIEASWDQAGDVVPVTVEEPPDPTNGAGAPTSPPSAASGA